MPYRIKEGQQVLLVYEKRIGGKLLCKTFNRTVDFNYGDVIASPLTDHHKDGIKSSDHPNYPWGFRVTGKWENAGTLVELYATEVHVIPKGGLPKDAQTVVVKGSKGNEYTLMLNETVPRTALTCSCPGFRFKQTCKHLESYNLLIRKGISP